MSNSQTQLEALREIRRIVHTPTKATKHKDPNAHYQADFDAIRRICAVFAEAAE